MARGPTDSKSCPISQGRNIPPKEESLICKDVDLFRLRSERKKWEIEQAKRKGFIQSTRR